MITINLASIAAALAAKGFRIFPLLAGAKTPAIRSWPEKATSEAAAVEAWWEADPARNIGLATGGGLLVLDLDVKGGKDGIAALNDWELANEFLPSTFSVRTATGGIHYYYRTSRSFTNKVDIYPGVDLRGNGGYVVAPGSITSQGTYEVIEDLPIAEANEAVFAFIQGRELGQRFSLPAIIPEGQRDSTIVKYAFSLQGQGLPDEEIRALVHQANMERCVPPLNEKTVEIKIEQALKKPKGPSFLADLEVDLPAADISYLHRDDKGKIHVNTSLLAEAIRKHSNYIIVRKQGFDSDLLYWYVGGIYRRVSSNEFKGYLKRYVPKAIRRPQHWEEAYKELITDRAVTPLEALDTEETVINFRNGLYNVKSRCLEPHRPDILTSIQLHTDFNPAAASPARFLAFLDFLSDGDKEIQAVLQEFAGLTISNFRGYAPKKALVLYGPEGNNGKSVFIKLVEFLIGTDFIASRPIQDLSKSFATSDLYGKRALLIDDQKSADLTDSSVFKSITSGGPVSCEFKGKQAFSYSFRGTVIMGCNELPYLGGHEEKGSHFFERFVIIPCTRVLSEHERDPGLMDDLQREIEGIANWALEGLHRLIANNFKLTRCARSIEVGEEYRKKSDSLYRFVSENYLLTGDKLDRIPKAEFEAEYERWAWAEGVRPIERKNVQLRAQKIGIPCRKISTFFYVGLSKVAS